MQLIFYTLLKNRFGEPLRVFNDPDKMVWAFPMTGRRDRDVAISVCHQLTPILYDLSKFKGNLDAFLDDIVIRDPSGRRDRRQ